PHGPATWGSGDLATDWAAAATRAGNAVLSVNPDWLVFVEGIQTYDGASYWWGGNLMGARDHPIRLDRPDKLVYSAHDYPPSLYRQPWLREPRFEARLPAIFQRMWGYLSETGTAPVFIGELGSKFEEPDDELWMKAMTAYLNREHSKDGVKIGWSWWAWNPNSGDTGGLLA
ncbi:glycoside hydrolase family 5 protein, partial [Azospirillum rugosum]